MKHEQRHYQKMETKVFTLTRAYDFRRLALILTVVSVFGCEKSRFDFGTSKKNAAVNSVASQAEESECNDRGAPLKFVNVGPVQHSQPGGVELKNVVQVFANGNSFVRFQDAVYANRIQVNASAQLKSDELMELLLKVRTSRDLGAHKVTVAFDRQLDEQVSGISRQHLLQMLYVAGAHEVSEGGKLLDASKWPQLKRSFKIPTRTPVLFSLRKDGLATELAQLLKIKKVTIDDVQELTPNKFTFQAHEDALVLGSLESPSNASFLKSLEVIYRISTLLNMRVHAIFPYLPYARSDKIDQAGVTVGGRLAADLIEAAGAAEVSFARPHAPQSQGFFSVPTNKVAGTVEIGQKLKSLGVDLVIAPDAGAQKDATLFAESIGVPIAIMNKQRDPLTGKSTILGVSDMSGLSKQSDLVAAIFDDETASGGTLADAAAVLKRSQSFKRVYGAVSHLAGGAEKAIESSDLDALVVSNSFQIESSSAKLFVVSLATEFAQAISARLANLPEVPCSK